MNLTAEQRVALNIGLSMIQIEQMADLLAAKDAEIARLTSTDKSDDTSEKVPIA